MPELRDLRAFVAVAEQLSFTRAAELLHLRQQSVSRVIRDLERELGVELLERTTREVRVTPAGVALLEQGRDALRRADAAFAAARAVGTGRSGTIRIGATPPVGMTDRADLVGALRRDGPELSISFHDLRPGDLRASLEDRRVDIALTRISGTGDDRLDCAELRPTPMLVCLPGDAPLAGRPGLGLADLDGQRLLTPSPAGTSYTDLLLSRFAAAGATVHPVEARVTGGGALLAELVHRDAIAVVPVGSAIPERIVAVPVASFTLPLFVLWPAGRPPSAVRLLRQAMAS